MSDAMTRRVPDHDLVFGRDGFVLGIAGDPSIELVPIAVDDVAPDDVVDDRDHGDRDRDFHGDELAASYTVDDLLAEEFDAAAPAPDAEGHA